MSEAGGSPIAFIGLGNMGSPMVVRLLQAGLPVTGFDLSADARDRLVAAGGSAANSAAEAAAQADVVILMLPDSSVVEAVLVSPDVALALRPGSVVVDMSS
ncbi:MAG: NAD(P)-binding domain-containing protein, partial [Acidimicrobiaceae bacterium]|nr:NAD(P)-binding domain-containing protein [Acidimicrobiaceae bacterium]